MRAEQPAGVAGWHGMARAQTLGYMPLSGCCAGVGVRASGRQGSVARVQYDACRLAGRAIAREPIARTSIGGMVTYLKSVEFHGQQLQLQSGGVASRCFEYGVREVARLLVRLWCSWRAKFLIRRKKWQPRGLLCLVTGC